MPSPRPHARRLSSQLTTTAVCYAFLSLFSVSQAASQSVLANDRDYVCEHPPYEVHLVSSSPLVVYLTGFVTLEECAHLKASTEHTFAHSAVAERGTADGRAIHSVRTSQSTNVPRDAVVRCIEERALRFQGLFDEDHKERLEPLQLVKYGAGEHYHYHTDWFTDPVHATAPLGGNRASSFFAYVYVSNGTTDGPEAEKAAGGAETATHNPKLRGGGTNFPLLNARSVSGENTQWCSYMDCDEPWERGVTFRPVQGNAVYWDNLLPASDQGRVGDPRTLHAGLPVVGGEKIGMNIWTREGAVPAAVRGE